MSLQLEYKLCLYHSVSAQIEDFSATGQVGNLLGQLLVKQHSAIKKSKPFIEDISLTEFMTAPIKYIATQLFNKYQPPDGRIVWN